MRCKLIGQNSKLFIGTNSTLLPGDSTCRMVLASVKISAKNVCTLVVTCPITRQAYAQPYKLHRTPARSPSLSPFVSHTIYSRTRTQRSTEGPSKAWKAHSNPTTLRAVTSTFHSLTCWCSEEENGENCCDGQPHYLDYKRMDLLAR